MMSNTYMYIIYDDAFLLYVCVCVVVVVSTYTHILFFLFIFIPHTFYSSYSFLSLFLLTHSVGGGEYHERTTGNSPWIHHRRIYTRYTRKYPNSRRTGKLWTAEAFNPSLSLWPIVLIVNLFHYIYMWWFFATAWPQHLLDSQHLLNNKLKSIERKQTNETTFKPIKICLL